MPPLPTHQSPRRVRSLFFPWRRRGLGWCGQPATPGAASAARAWLVPQRPRWVCPAGCAPGAQAEPAGERAPKGVRAPDDEGAPAWGSAHWIGTVHPEAACAPKPQAQPAPPAGLPRLAKVRRSATTPALPTAARRDPDLGPSARPLSSAARLAPSPRRIVGSPKVDAAAVWANPAPLPGIRERAGRGLPKGGHHSPSASPAPRAPMSGPRRPVGSGRPRCPCGLDGAAPAQRLRAQRCGPGCGLRDWGALPPAPRTTWNRALGLLSSVKACPCSYPSTPRPLAELSSAAPGPRPWVEAVGPLAGLGALASAPPRAHCRACTPLGEMSPPLIAPLEVKLLTPSTLSQQSGQLLSMGFGKSSSMV